MKCITETKHIKRENERSVNLHKMNYWRVEIVVWRKEGCWNGADVRVPGQGTLKETRDSGSGLPIFEENKLDRNDIFAECWLAKVSKDKNVGYVCSHEVDRVYLIYRRRDWGIFFEPFQPFYEQKHWKGPGWPVIRWNSVEKHVHLILLRNLQQIILIYILGHRFRVRVNYKFLHSCRKFSREYCYFYRVRIIVWIISTTKYHCGEYGDVKNKFHRLSPWH